MSSEEIKTYTCSRRGIYCNREVLLKINSAGDGDAAGARGGAGAARGRQQDGLLWRAPRQVVVASLNKSWWQALSGAGVAWWEEREPRPLRHCRGGGVARSPEGKAAAERAAAAPPLTSEEALQQANAEEPTLLVSDDKAGYCTSA